MLPEFTGNPIQLGLGLIGIGRPWGHSPSPVPSPAETQRFLQAVIESGVRYLDTAPSYARSEQRLGAFLRMLTPDQRARCTIATKFGEDWDFSLERPFIEHSYDGMRRSLDRSFKLLGQIDVLQLHKTTPDALASHDVQRAFDYARSLGIGMVGPSVSDEQSAQLAIDSPAWQMLQMPANIENQRFLPFVESATRAGKWLALNRPLAMGKRAADRLECFRFVKSLPFRGIVLMGTASIDHLRENLAAFAAAK